MGEGVGMLYQKEPTRCSHAGPATTCRRAQELKGASYQSGRHLHGTGWGRRQQHRQPSKAAAGRGAGQFQGRVGLAQRRHKSKTHRG